MIPENPATQRTVRIGGREVGPGAAPFVIAEMSGNHDGDLDKALAIVRAAAEAGAHAVKLQTYTADTITIDVDTPGVPPLRGARALGRPPPLRALRGGPHPVGVAPSRSSTWPASSGLLAFSSPFDPTAVEFLEDLDVPAYKIASSEIVDLPLIRLAAQPGKPLIISTGMASVGEIAAAVEAARATGNDASSCCSRARVSYPADPATSNLRGIPVLR